MSPHGVSRPANRVKHQPQAPQDDVTAAVPAPSAGLGVLEDPDMTLGNVVRLNRYTTDVDAMMGCYDILAERFAAAGVRPTSTLVGVTRLAFPELLVELEATAVE